MIDNVKNAGFKVTVRHGQYTSDYDKVEDLADDHNGEVVDSGNDGKRLDYSEVYFRGESDSLDFIQSALREGLQPTKSFRAASSVNVVLTHSAKRVASLHAAPKYASNDLTTECKYWAEHFARKFGAGHSITQTRRGGCKINWNENWGGYSIEGNEIGNVIVWTSGRDKAANLPREIEKLVKKARSEARNMFDQETRDWAREVAYRYAKEHANEDALKQYLKDHPDADKSKHTVKKDKGSGSKSDSEPGSLQEAANDFGYPKDGINGMREQDFAKFLKTEKAVGEVGADKVTKAYEKHKGDMEYDEKKALKSTADKLSKSDKKVEEEIKAEIKKKINSLPHGSSWGEDDLMQYVKGEEDNLGEKLEDMDKYEQKSIRELFPKGAEEKYKKAVADSKKWKALADGIKTANVKANVASRYLKSQRGSQ